MTTQVNCAPEAIASPRDVPDFSRRRRPAVSAESVSNEAIDDWEPPVFAKSLQETSFLKGVVESERMNVLFGHLSTEKKAEVVKAMERRDVPSGETVIQQGDMGDYFYVVESGKFDIFVQRGSDAPRKVMEATRGNSFGELALLYNAPRAATCTAAEDSVVWTLDRNSFRMMVVTCENTKKRRYESFLEGIDIFKYLNKYEIGQLSDLLTPEKFSPGEAIISQGETGDKFYIVSNGVCICTMRENGGPEIEVLTYSRGGFFGELALMCDSPRKATVRAVNEVEVLWINKKTFDRVLGPIVDNLRKHSESYLPYKHFLEKNP